MTPISSSGRFKLAKASGGKCAYAEVAVQVIQDERGNTKEISWSDKAAKGLMGIHEFRRGIERGVAIALAAFPEPVSELRIEETGVLLVDSNENSMTYAACFAVWDALRICGCNPPRLEAGEFIFPETE
jgi:hypothetical protein